MAAQRPATDGHTLSSRQVWPAIVALVLGGMGCGGDERARPSCLGVPATCSGPDPNCCGSNLVAGGTFQRDNVDDPMFAATVASFRLDSYEVTVARFRKFVEAYPTNQPAAGSGRNPNNPADPGWDADWSSFLPGNRETLTKDVQCDPDYQTWGAGGDNDHKAINCVTWFEAMAFCIWDEGRLPTNAEWNYAAAGGSDQRYYPWSNPFSSQAIDASYAVYSPAPSVAAVGSKSPKGDGKYGHADLGGNVWEWVQDWYSAPYPYPCDDCSNFEPSTERMIRGGSFYDGASYVPSDTADVYDPTFRVNYIGFRCARRP